MKLHEETYRTHTSKIPFALVAAVMFASILGLIPLYTEPLPLSATDAAMVADCTECSVHGKTLPIVVFGHAFSW